MKTSSRILLAITAFIFVAAHAHATMFFARPYDPNLQRWISRDPIGELGGINLFTYVKNDPVNLYDPFGLSPETELTVAIARGDAAAIETILDAWGADLSLALRQAGQAALKKLRSKCGDLIRGSLKRSKSYHSELETKTYEELLQDSSKAAKQMRKLIDESKRLMEKNK